MERRAKWSKNGFQLEIYIYETALHDHWEYGGIISNSYYGKTSSSLSGRVFATSEEEAYKLAEVKGKRWLSGVLRRPEDESWN